jgi:phosphotransferase system HPr (HPr) family protein
MPQITIQVLNKVGLHARPAALFVQEANKYQCDIRVRKDGTEANAKSILSILMLGAEQGCSIAVVAEGEDADAALAALQALANANFLEPE